MNTIIIIFLSFIIIDIFITHFFITHFFYYSFLLYVRITFFILLNNNGIKKNNHN